MKSGPDIDNAWDYQKLQGWALPESWRRGCNRDFLDIQTGLLTEHLGAKSRTTPVSLVVEGGWTLLTWVEGGMPTKLVTF